MPNKNVYFLQSGFASIRPEHKLIISEEYQPGLLYQSLLMKIFNVTNPDLKLICDSYIYFYKMLINASF